MRFRPCIDIHNGKVKQLIGGTLRDSGDVASENYVSPHPALYYAQLYREKGLGGGHVILLNGADSSYYDATRTQALQALRAFPGGLQAGGGINDENAEVFLEAGASHVIVTSFVFRNGELNWGNLDKLQRAVGRERLVLDLSCRKRGGNYYVVTERWQNFSDFQVTRESLSDLSSQCAEFLIHGVDVEGLASGIDEGLLSILADVRDIPVTYAGGVRSLYDIEKIYQLGKGRADFTVGSALSLFGGALELDEVEKWTISLQNHKG